MKKLIGRTVIVVFLIFSTKSWAIDFVDNGGGSFTAASSTPQDIPDYPSSGIAYSLNFNNSYFNDITSVSITFTTTGGWNGDLYAYLSNGNGIAILLNQVGASASNPNGYGTSGFNNITLTTSGTDIHTVPNPTSGDSYSADGRVNYADTSRPDTLNVFTGTDPNGAWTLYFSDQSPQNTSTLSTFSVNLEAVPEPATWGAISGIGLLGLCGFRSWRQRRSAKIAAV